VTQYSYNDNDQLTEEVTDGNVSSYEYDDNGAIVSKDAGGDPNHYYSYDLRGRLAQLQVENGVTLNYLYNPDGIRVRAAVQAGSTTDYLIDPYNHTGYAQVLKEVGNANTVYIYGLDALAHAAGTNEPKYLLYDGHGSVRQLANFAGLVTNAFAYDAYGSAHGFNPAEAATKLLYTGESYDQNIQQYYLRARWYDPHLGQFNRLDPYFGATVDPLTLHKYNYASQDPVNKIDPSGREPLPLYYGRRVHDEIGQHFELTGVDRLYDKSINRILRTRLRWYGLQRPDLVDRDSGEVYEIKSLRSAQLGVIQLGWYLLLLNSLDPYGRYWYPGISYRPPPIVVIDARSFAVVSPPIGGVIIYQVLDLRPVISVVIAYSLYRVVAELAIRVELKSLSPGLALI
jgi:RHS repeat-associated protein